MIATLMLVCGALAADPTASFKAPERYYEGRSYTVELTVTAPEGGGSIPVWLLTPAGFDLDGKALGARDARASLELTSGAQVSMTIDLGPTILAAKNYEKRDFELTLAKAFKSGEPVAVARFAPAAKGTNFMEIPAEELAQYQVLMKTNQGEMRIELWPDVAPNTVRNFLDLSHTGFYDGLIFHRVIPGFMIQGGDPTGTGTGSGPRKLKAEFSDKKHVRGVLSMARLGHDVDSATSQFFVCHASAPNLDGQYTAFGKVLEGVEAVDRIVSAKRPPVGDKDRPIENQTMLEVIVVHKGAQAAKGKQ